MKEVIITATEYRNLVLSEIKKDEVLIVELRSPYKDRSKKIVTVIPYELYLTIKEKCEKHR